MANDTLFYFEKIIQVTNLIIKKLGPLVSNFYELNVFGETLVYELTFIYPTLSFLEHLKQNNCIVINHVEQSES